MRGAGVHSLRFFKKYKEVKKLEYYINLAQLRKLAERTNEELDQTIRTVRVEDNNIKFYNEKNAGANDKPAFVVALSKSDTVVEQVDIELVENFTFSKDKYTDAVNPNLDGKTVLVLKKNTGYEFINISGIAEAVKISAADGNALEAKDDGLYVTTRVEDAIENNIIISSQNGQPADSKRTFASDNEVQEMLNEVFGL